MKTSYQNTGSSGNKNRHFGLPERISHSCARPRTQPSRFGRPDQNRRFRGSSLRTETAFL